MRSTTSTVLLSQNCYGCNLDYLHLYSTAILLYDAPARGLPMKNRNKSGKRTSRNFTGPAGDGMLIRLGCDDLFYIEVQRWPVEICCISGTLWVTQTGDLQDHIVSCGEAFTTDRKGRVIVWAMITDALVEVRNNGPIQ